MRGTYPAAQRPICPGNDLVTLEDILFSTHKARQPFTNEDRYALAITLVASFLQLYKTPWVGDRWTERDIHFFQAPQDPRSRLVHRVKLSNSLNSRQQQHPLHISLPSLQRLGYRQTPSKQRYLSTSSRSHHPYNNPRCGDLELRCPLKKQYPTHIPIPIPNTNQNPPIPTLNPTKLP